MIESIVSAVIEVALGLLWWLILWPMMIVVSTPFVMLYAGIAAIREHRRFSYAVTDGYSAVSNFWYKLQFWGSR